LGDSSRSLQNHPPEALPAAEFATISPIGWNTVEHSNGVFIQAVTEVKNVIATRDEIISQSVGLAGEKGSLHEFRKFSCLLD
jgi:hypothetical protein